MTDDISAYQRTDNRGTYLVIGRGATPSEIQAREEWIASDTLHPIN